MGIRINTSVSREVNCLPVHTPTKQLKVLKVTPRSAYFNPVPIGYNLLHRCKFGTLDNLCLAVVCQTEETSLKKGKLAANSTINEIIDQKRKKHFKSITPEFYQTWHSFNPLTVDHHQTSPYRSSSIKVTRKLLIDKQILLDSTSKKCIENSIENLHTDARVWRLIKNDKMIKGSLNDVKLEFNILSWAKVVN